MAKISSLVSLLLIIFLSPIVADGRYKEAVNIKVFESELVNFDPSKYKDGVTLSDNIIRIANGRIILKKIDLPHYDNYSETKINIRLTSNGDRWDKSGSCFIIPKGSAINMISIANNTNEYPEYDTSKYENLVGIVGGKEYLPPIELMRFMTPFGVGHYSDSSDSVSAARKPVYIDNWANYVEWQDDITDLSSMLEDETYIGLFIDTWTEEGYKVDVTLTQTESNIEGDIKPKSKVLPLINTVYYLGQKHPDIFSRKDVEVPFSLPQGAKNVRLKYITTGHGGHSGGDEFRPQENILYIDNNEILNFMPWRTDCASFRRFNPTSGVWLQKREVAYISRDGSRTKKEIEEPLASSDLSRSNWCPGSNVEPIEIKLSDINYGDHTLKISIPKSTSIDGDKLNHWLVSAYLVWDEM